ncbi:MAG: hypothetical protein Kow0062_18340 [Acidobacteriota bacterium]
MRRSRALAAILLFAISVPCIPRALAGDTMIHTATLRFALDKPLPLKVKVGDLEVRDLTITREERRLLDQVLPPRGGQSRFSWLHYAVHAENPADVSWNLAVRVKLLDRSGAIIDEFEFRERVWRGRARTVDLRRITLNYVIPLIDKVEITLTADR